MEHVIFKLINENFAIRLDQIKEILVYDQMIITPLFNEKPWLNGLINLRGEVIPIYDLRVKFNKENPKFDDSTVAIVVKTSEGKLVGMIVDRIEQIMPIKSSQVSQTYDLDIGIDKKFIKNLIKLNETQMTVLLDIDKIFQTQKKEEIA